MGEGFIIYSKFLNLPLEKQQVILNAAMKEFVLKGYQNASTNEIVKMAGISKGLLFHYFESKKNLFLFLCEYNVEVVTTQFYQKANFKEADLFKRIKDMTLIKLQLLHQYPEIFNFLTAAFNETHDDVQHDLKERLITLSEKGYNQLFEGIDYEKFNHQFDVAVLLNMMMWTYQGFTETALEHLKKSDDLEADFYRIFTDIEKYTNTMRALFYA